MVSLVSFATCLCWKQRQDCQVPVIVCPDCRADLETSPRQIECPLCEDGSKGFLGNRGMTTMTSKNFTQEGFKLRDLQAPTLKAKRKAPGMAKVTKGFHDLPLPIQPFLRETSALLSNSLRRRHKKEMLGVSGECKPQV